VTSVRLRNLEIQGDIKHTVLVDQSPSDVLHVVTLPPIRVCGHPYVNFSLRCGKARNVVTKLAAFLLTCPVAGAVEGARPVKVKDRPK